MGWEPAFSAEQAELTADELARYAKVSADIAQGLGDEVTVVGLSVGGVLGGWHAQRRELAHVLLISPVFDLPQVPDPLFAPVVRLAAVLPNFFFESDVDGREYVYPHDATRPVSAFLLMASAVRDAADEAAPAARAITVVTNANDETVAHDAIREVVMTWREQGAQVSTYEFPQDLELGHDLIDPRLSDARTDLVYPVLFRLLQGQVN
jgi:esterase/lipase